MLSRVGKRSTRRGAALPGDPDDVQSRYIEAAVNGVLIGGLYLPNGNPGPGPKFDYKLPWFERLIDACRRPARDRRAGRAGRRLQRDADRARRLQARALGRRRAVRARGARGLPPPARRRAGPTRCARSIPARRSTPSGTISGTPTARDAGLRIDHLLLSPAVAERLIDARVDRAVRGWEKTSDHAPGLDRARRRSARAPEAKGPADVTGVAQARLRWENQRKPHPFLSRIPRRKPAWVFGAFA